MLIREKSAMIYAIDIPPDKLSPELLASVSKIPNLEQVQLSRTSVTDDDLRYLLELRRLEGIGLNQTAITERGIKLLKSNPSLKLIQTDRDTDN